VLLRQRAEKNHQIKTASRITNASAAMPSRIALRLLGGAGVAGLAESVMGVGATVAL
jgi:hypothetical protein